MKKFFLLGMLCIMILTAVSCANELRTSEDYLSMYDAWLAENQEWVTLYPFEENGLWGYMDESGDVIIQPQFRMARSFSEGLAFVTIGEHTIEQRGYIDVTGEIVIPRPMIGYWDGEFSDGFAHVIERAYERNENRRAIGPLGPYIFIDRTGQNIFGQEFAGVRPFREGFARVIPLRGNPFFIDRTGAHAFDGMEFRLISSDFKDGYANVILLDGTAAYIDRLGNIERGWRD